MYNLQILHFYFFVMSCKPCCLGIDFKKWENKTGYFEYRSFNQLFKQKAPVKVTQRKRLSSSKIEDRGRMIREFDEKQSCMMR